MKRRTSLSLGALIAISIGIMVALSSCGRNYNDPGTEYAPQMYHSIPYEDYTQITDTTSEDYNSNPYNPHRQNLRKPAKGTISRQFNEGQPRTMLAADIMQYNIPNADSMAWSERNLHNPFQPTEKNLADGKLLYTRFCSPCHGAEGKGNGKVADMYKGVPNYSTGRVATVNEGHIYHTITYGKGRMWPHGTQIMPAERWKIVLFVQTLQKGDAAAAPAASPNVEGQNQSTADPNSTAPGTPAGSANSAMGKAVKS